ncbi:fam-m protein [Plasmodium brasilianum]|uniref:Fam-m protein n=1 Tax=Plasmodium brasilianum TaxID=5824 RepID=A0ACB9Y648_PLABR|nr:fam-m protein [Plasmodium brasilianum]
MELNINRISFIIISAFILLTKIFFFNHDMTTFNRFLCEKFVHCRKLDTRNYRLLSKYKQDKDSTNVWLPENFPNNRKREKKNITNNKKWASEKHKKSNDNLMNKAQYYTEVVDYNNGIFDGKHFHFEKKLIKKRDYDDFLERQRRIIDIALKKITFRNYGFGGTIFLLFFLLGIGLPILQGFKLLQSAGDVIKTLPGMTDLWGYVEGLLGDAKCHFFIISFGILMVILFVILIIMFPKILKNNEKYNKLKMMME